MIKCELCGKEFKNTQGLRGHKTFVHGITGSCKAPSTPLATEQRLSKLEELLEITSQDTDKPASKLLSELNGRLELSEQYTDRLTEELKKLVEQHAGQLKNSHQQLSELRDLLREAVSVIGEDQYLLLLGIGGHEHDPKTGAVTFTAKRPLVDRLKLALEQAKDWESIAQVAEMFEPARKGHQFAPHRKQGGPLPFGKTVGKLRQKVEHEH